MLDKKITLSDIAKAANVSVSTVSRAINHPEQLNPSTLKKITHEMTNLGFSVNANPSMAPEGKIIITIIPNFGNPYYDNIIEGIKSSAELSDFHVLLVSLDQVSEGSKYSIIEILQTTKAAGLILATRSLSTDLLNYFDSIVPVVQCGEYNKLSHVPHVIVDDYNAAKEVTDYLISTGHSRIAFIAGHFSSNLAQERLRGFDDSLSAHGIEVPQNWRIHVPKTTYDVGYSAICQLLSNQEKPNAIFASCDLFAVSTIRAAKKFNISIPQELSIVGFDNIDITNMIVPSISTIKQPSFQMGFTSCELLKERINNPTVIPNSLVFDTELILRESSLPRSKVI
ncbi:MAG: LacI family DNA-binding transcriptional regulator [Anaerolineaceae bacterium]|nr:LacI family DNA-binding transcriptional regulator [Anaerolineaceae bacterium]